MFNPAILTLMPFYCSNATNVIITVKIAEVISFVGVMSYGTRKLMKYKS